MAAAGAAAHLAAGSARGSSGLRRRGGRAPRIPPQVRAVGRAGPRCPAGEVSWRRKVQLCAAIPGMSGGRGGLGPRGSRFQGPQEREGGQARGGEKDAGSGAHPLGEELRSQRAAPERERGPGPGLGRTVASPGPDSLTTKAAAAGEPWGAAGGRTEAAPRRPRVGWGGATSGRAATALRLLKSEQLLVLRAASGVPARLPASPRTSGRFQEFRQSHVCKFFAGSKPSRAAERNKRKENPGVWPGSQARAAAESRASPPPLRAPTAPLSPSRPSPASHGGGRSRLRRRVR